MHSRLACIWAFTSALACGWDDPLDSFAHSLAPWSDLCEPRRKMEESESPTAEAHQTTITCFCFFLICILLLCISNTYAQTDTTWAPWLTRMHSAKRPTPNPHTPEISSKNIKYKHQLASYQPAPTGNICCACQSQPNMRKHNTTLHTCVLMSLLLLFLSISGGQSQLINPQPADQLGLVFYWQQNSCTKSASKYLTPKDIFGNLFTFKTLHLQKCTVPVA